VTLEIQGRTYCVSPLGLGKIVAVSEIADKIRRICARMVDEQLDSARAAMYRSELQAATRELVAEQNAWSTTSERDTHQDEARQSYRSREADSADGFAEGLKLFNPRKPDTDKKKA
jgi:hypothetical protein